MVESDKPPQDIEKAATDLASRLTTRLEKVEQLAEAVQNETGGSERLNELKELLQQNVNNTQLLLQAIEQKAPELANRPAVKAFINNTRVRYEQALKAAGVSAEEIKKIEGGGATGNTTTQTPNGSTNIPQLTAVDEQSFEVASTPMMISPLSGELHCLSFEPSISRHSEVALWRLKNLTALSSTPIPIAAKSSLP